MIKRIFSALFVAGLSTSAVAGGDIHAGQELAKNMCAACHGADGISAAPMWPNLKGQKEQYLILQLENFKTSTRKNSMMEPIAAAINQQQIENLAAYYGSLKP